MEDKIICGVCGGKATNKKGDCFEKKKGEGTLCKKCWNKLEDK